MCRNQLGRRNITDEQKTALIGEAYKAQKMTQGAQAGNDNVRKQSHQNEDFVSEPEGKTKFIVAKQFGVGGSTVERAEHFVDGLDAAEKVSPGTREAVLSGEVKAPKNIISEIRNMPEEHRPSGNICNAPFQGTLANCRILCYGVGGVHVGHWALHKRRRLVTPP